MVLKIYSEPSLELLETYNEHTDFVEILEYLLQYASIEEITRAENILIHQKLRLREKNGN